jgi:hypothetical protein
MRLEVITVELLRHAAVTEEEAEQIQIFSGDCKPELPLQKTFSIKPLQIRRCDRIASSDALPIVSRRTLFKRRKSYEYENS